jgi:hypothetical protein
MFEKSLQDLVKGIRNTKGDTTQYIAKAIAEIKDEVKSRDVTVKAQALQKMTYVRSLPRGSGGGGGAYVWGDARAEWPLIRSRAHDRFAATRPRPICALLLRSCTCWATTWRGRRSPSSRR